jgi:hypothetical protein
MCDRPVDGTVGHDREFRSVISEAGRRSPICSGWSFPRQVGISPFGYGFLANLDSPKQAQHMAANSSFMIAEAERSFPVRIRIGVPSDGLGSRLNRIKAWLDENCGANGWAITRPGTGGGLNDALSIYFGDAALASAFVARCCAGHKVETGGGVFQVREDEPMHESERCRTGRNERRRRDYALPVRAGRLRESLLLPPPIFTLWQHF